MLFILCNYIQLATFNTSWEKKSSIYFKDFTGFRFFLFSLKIPVYLVRYAVTQSICCTINFGQFGKFQYHLEHFPRHTGFLSFGGPSNYLYLFRNHRKTFSWPGNVRHPTSKLSKYWFGSNIKYVSEPFFADSCCWEGISCVDLVQNLYTAPTEERVVGNLFNFVMTLPPAVVTPQAPVKRKTRSASTTVSRNQDIR